ncbi:MAG: protein kinase [Chloroflexi bacterium]|nr:protein kinase [Chloroflexota bacterium]
MIGQLLQKRYRLEQELGRGGMGVVYQGHDTLLNRPVAVKLLSASNLGSRGRNRLLTEAQAVARLNHPNIINVYDVGFIQPTSSAPISPDSPTEKYPFIVMELVAGQTLRQFVRPDLETGLSILRQICAALEHAHTHNLIHRDLKPENIMLTATQTVKLMDFGLARSVDAPHLTQEGAVAGTLAYLAPELLRGQPATVQSDLYALGVIAYELLTGRAPFQNNNLAAVISQHLYANVIPPSAYNREIQPALDGLVLHLLHKQPHDRPKSALAVRESLEHLHTVTDQLPLPVSALDHIVRGRIVGREREFGEAMSRWQRACQGETSVLLISGEPGIGKTRLARELMAIAEASRATVLLGECYAEGGAPYAPIAQMIQTLIASPDLVPLLSDAALTDLHPMLPGLRTSHPHLIESPNLDPPAEQHRLFEQMATLCAALTVKQPLLLVVDDAHWADGSTLALLRYLTRRGRQAHLPLLILCTYREIELDDDHTFADFLADLHRERLTQRLKLTRLTPEQTLDMLMTLFAGEVTAGFRDLVYRETEGNPFFIEELCKALIEDGQVYRENGQWLRASLDELRIPQSVHLAIQSRLSKLESSVQDILRLAAIIGREFEFPTLFQASDLDEETLIAHLEKAERAQLIEETPGRGPERFAFAHALIPATLRDNLSSLRRHRLHRRVAGVIEQLHPDDLETLAYHYSEAGDEVNALAYTVRAGDRALSVYANREAERYYHSALLLAQEPGERASLYSNLGQSLFRQSRYTEAINSWGEAIAAYQTEGNGDVMAGLYARSARAAAYSGNVPQSLALCTAGITALVGWSESAGRAALYHEAARAYHFSGQPELAQQYCDMALVLARQLGAIEVEAEALTTLGMLPGQPYAAQLEHYQQAIHLAEQGRFLGTATRAYNNLANTLEETGDLLAARAYYQRAAALAHQRQSPSEELFVSSQVANISLWLGDLEAVVQQVADLRQLLTQVGDEGGWGASGLRLTEILLLRRQGEWEQSLPLMTAFQAEMRQRGDLQHLFNINYDLAELLCEMGHWDEAEAPLREALEIGERGVVGWGLVRPRCLLAAVCASLNRWTEAQDHLTLARQQAGDDPSLWEQEALALTEARLATLAGQEQEAQQAFERATLVRRCMGIVSE